MGFRTVRILGGIILTEFYQPEENPNLVYSQTFGNLTVDSITLSTENLKNHAIVLGAGEGEDRPRAEIDNSGGGQKLSLIVDARDITREETDTDDSYQEKLLARGNEKLLEKTKTWKCLFTPLAADFGTRFDLGDILTVLLHHRFDLFISQALVFQIFALHMRSFLAIRCLRGSSHGVSDIASDCVCCIKKPPVGGLIMRWGFPWACAFAQAWGRIRAGQVRPSPVQAHAVHRAI
jgi:hypothetical protein